MIGITQKKLEELRPVEASCARVAELEEEVERLGQEGSEVEVEWGCLLLFVFPIDLYASL